MSKSGKFVIVIIIVIIMLIWLATELDIQQWTLLMIATVALSGICARMIEER